MSVEIIKMGMKQISDINKPNQPFLITGRIVPKFDGNEWSFDEDVYENPYYKEYPNDEIDYSVIYMRTKEEFYDVVVKEIRSVLKQK